MQARDFMSETVYCCTRDTSLRDVARTMADCDCGAVPVVDDSEHKRVIGIITDRDIVVRTLARDRNPLELAAGDCMTAQTITVASDTSEEELVRLMEEHQIRRVPVINRDGMCVGIVSQADIARKGNEHEAAELLREVSRQGRAAA